MLKEIIQFVPVIALSYFGQVLMKRGVSSIGILSWADAIHDPFNVFAAILKNANIMLGFVFAGLGGVLYLFALSKTDLTVAVPILGALGFLILPIIGGLFLNEPVTGTRIIGIAIIAIGMIVVGRS
ncbi:MAG: hypothetical protein ABTQ25_03725 [Nitrosomonas ureae]